MLYIPRLGENTLLSISENSVETLELTNVQTNNTFTIRVVEAPEYVHTRTFNFRVIALTDKGYDMLSELEKNQLAQDNYLIKNNVTLIHQVPGMYTYKAANEVGILKIGQQTNNVIYDEKDNAIIYKS
jgi:hypothetical protein